MRWVGIITVVVICVKFILSLLYKILKILIYPFKLLFIIIKGLLIKDDYNY